MKRIVLDFTGISILCTVGFGLISYFFADLGPSTGTTANIIAAMSSGSLYGTRTGKMVNSGFAWRVAAVLTVVSFILSAIPAAIIFPGLFTDGPFGVLIGIIAVVGLMTLLAIRLMFGFGVKMATRQTRK